VPALAALALALLAGCGDDGGEAVTTDVDALVPSKRDYVVQADTICGRAGQSIQTEAEVFLGIDSSDFELTESGEIVFLPGRAPRPAEVRRFGTEVVLPTLREQLADLRALTPPAGDEETVSAIYDRAERGIERLEANPDAFTDSDAVRSALTEARRLGRRYGFFDCGTYSGP
jgi:hypothetical protein